jgi:DNA repair protein SbcD/Mre11
MSSRPFRFIHASDFHLEQPLMGVAEVPDHLRELFLEAPYTAARRVFEAALVEDVKFVVLSGGIVAAAVTGPCGPLFLAEQFTRLAERRIGVYWAGATTDPPEVWPAAVRLPQNVHVFARGRVEDLLVQSDAGPLARVAGASCDQRRPWQPTDFQPDSAGLYTIAVVHGQPDSAVLQTRGLHYWALGGRHDRSTPLCAAAAPQTSVEATPVLPQPPANSQVAHYCGTPQGRRPEESGIHGCTLVQVDEQRQTRTSLIPTDAARWISERLLIDEGATADDLESRIRQRMHALLEAAPATALLISWTIAGRGPLLGSLRRAGGAAALLDRLRGDYGYRQPPAWSVSIEVELSETLPPEWYEQETIRGDFLRAIRQLQMNPDEPLALEQYLAETHRAGTLATAVAFPAKAAREAVLREAAALGVDLLSGEETQA